MIESERWVSVPWLAHRSGLSRFMIRNLCEMGKVVAIRSGQGCQWRIELSSARHLLPGEPAPGPSKVAVSPERRVIDSSRAANVVFTSNNEALENNFEDQNGQRSDERAEIEHPPASPASPADRAADPTPSPVSSEEMSALLGGTPSAKTLEAWARIGRLPGSKIGRHWMFDPVLVSESIFDANTTASTLEVSPANVTASNQPRKIYRSSLEVRSVAGGQLKVLQTGAGARGSRKAGSGVHGGSRAMVQGRSLIHI